MDGNFVNPRTLVINTIHKLRSRLVSTPYAIFASELKHIEQRIGTCPEQDIPLLLNRLPLEMFARLQLDRVPQYSALNAWLPQMASDQIQRDWTGQWGHGLLTQSIDFISTVVRQHLLLGGKSMAKSQVLDFGCGWGRLMRLLIKFTPASQLYGVDPWQASLDACTACDLPGTYLLSDYLPRTLPAPADISFDLIIAFSVFTHLSEKATTLALNALAGKLNDNGTLAITIRPAQYWHGNVILSKDQKKCYVDKHEQDGFVFLPHEREKIEGEVTYGDTSISLSWLESVCEKLQIKALEWNRSDPQQIIVLMKKR